MEGFALPPMGPPSYQDTYGFLDLPYYTCSLYTPEALGVWVYTFLCFTISDPLGGDQRCIDSGIYLLLDLFYLLFHWFPLLFISLISFYYFSL